jgi:hypothetical protein
MPKILQLKISLDEIKPQIWRSFLVYDDVSFEKFHNIIQKIMCWESYHLWEFSIDDSIKVGPIDEDVDYELEDAKKVKLKDYINAEKEKFYYLYDFGDSWNHIIVVEKIIEDDGSQKVPICIEGDRACPPEDCGGVCGYEELIKIKKDKNHPDYKEQIVDWLGEDFDFEEFDLNKINSKLRKF